MRDLKGALFNFHLPPAFAIEVLSSLMAISNRRPLRDGFDDFISLQCPALPDGLDPVAAALAVTLLADRGEAITDNFRHLAMYWFQEFREADPQFQELIKAAIETAWPSGMASQSPLNMPRLPIRKKGFHEILSDVQARFPRKLKSPKE